MIQEFEKLEVTAKEAQVRVFIESTQTKSAKLAQAETLCSKILLTKFVRKHENFYMRGSELVTNLKNFDLYCDQLSVNDFQEFKTIQSVTMWGVNDVETSELLD